MAQSADTVWPLCGSLCVQQVSLPFHHCPIDSSTRVLLWPLPLDVHVAYALLPPSCNESLVFLLWRSSL